MHEGAALPSWVALAYLIAGVCFILALRGLSNPETSRRGNRIGMVGMTIAVLTTLAHYVPLSGTEDPFPQVGLGTLAEILVAIAIGATIGIVTARRIAMTAMPQLVAAFHSLVGMAAGVVAAAAHLNSEAVGIAGRLTP